jgi:hypothetical protein
MSKGRLLSPCLTQACRVFRGPASNRDVKHFENMVYDLHLEISDLNIGIMQHYV